MVARLTVQKFLWKKIPMRFVLKLLLRLTEKLVRDWTAKKSKVRNKQKKLTTVRLSQQIWLLKERKNSPYFKLHNLQKFKSKTQVICLMELFLNISKPDSHVKVRIHRILRIRSLAVLRPKKSAADSQIFNKILIQ